MKCSDCKKESDKVNSHCGDELKNEHCECCKSKNKTKIVLVISVVLIAILSLIIFRYQIITYIRDDLFRPLYCCSLPEKYNKASDSEFSNSIYVNDNSVLNVLTVYSEDLDTLSKHRLELPEFWIIHDNEFYFKLFIQDDFIRQN